MASAKNNVLITNYRVMSSDYRVYLGLGSNQNVPQRQITLAIKYISQLTNTQILKFAPRYQTKAWGVTNQPDFINTVLVINTQFKPLALLKKLKIIEFRLMGRTVKQRWHSRCIDIDILYYANKPYQRAQIQLPHPYMSQRCFVLRPLLDTDPTQLPLAVKQVIKLRKTCCLLGQQQNNQLENNKSSRIMAQTP